LSFDRTISASLVAILSTQISQGIEGSVVTHLRCLQHAHTMFSLKSESERILNID